MDTEEHRPYGLVLKRTIRNVSTLLCEGITVGILPLVFPFRWLFRRFQIYRVRSVWTGQPIITMVLNASAERRLGFDAYTVVKSSYYITDQFDLEIMKKAGGRKIPGVLLTYATFLWVCVTADRVHAYMDGALLPSRKRFQFNCLELLLYRMLGIKLFVWTYGADVRSRQVTLQLGEPNCCTDCKSIGEACICDPKEGRENFRRVAKAARCIFSMGDMVEYTPGSREDLFFWPIDFNEGGGRRYVPAYPDNSNSRPLRVVHAPNHREFKGTRYIESAVQTLQKEGVPIELVLVERVPNEQALDIYRTADVVFDQCLIGFHGYFAIEAMALGKPVMCFIRDPERYLLHAEECPILNVHRDDLIESLRKLATHDRKSLPGIGRKSREYVEKYYSLDTFTARMGKCYRELGVSL